MKRLFFLFTVLISASVIISGCSFSLIPKKSALSVSAAPKATIFLDGEHIGQTPYYNEKLKPGEYVLKVVPEATGGQALTVWEGRINLTPGILTFVNRELGLTPEISSGEVLSFEPLADKNAISIAIVTTPDGAVITLDGEPKGFAPISIDSVSEGDHSLVISSPGYQEKTITAKTVKGNKLIVSVQLAREPIEISADEASQEEPDEDSPEDPQEQEDQIDASPEPSPQSSPKSSPQADAEDIDRPYVEINSPDTGWVNVRSEASTDGKEDTIITQVDHSETFPLKDTDNGWYQIEYETDELGWISGKYAEKYE